MVPYVDAVVAVTMMRVLLFVLHVFMLRECEGDNIYTSDLPPPSAPVQVMAYTDDITVASTHTSASAAKKYIQPYLHKVFAWTKQNNLLLNPDKTTHSVHTRPCRIYEQSGPNNTQQSTTHGNAGSGSYLRPKSHLQHTHPQHLSTSTQTSTNHKITHCNRMG